MDKVKEKGGGMTGSADRLREWLKGKEPDSAVECELLRLQLIAAQDRLALAMSYLMRLEADSVVAGDDERAAECAKVLASLLDGDAATREQHRRYRYYRVAYARISDYLADGAVAAILRRDKAEAA